MTDDWKGSHRGFQTHKNKKPPQQQQQQQQPVTITQKDWDKIDAILGNDCRDCLMLAMSSCADEYDSERHFRRTSDHT